VIPLLQENSGWHFGGVPAFFRGVFSNFGVPQRRIGRSLRRYAYPAVRITNLAGMESEECKFALKTTEFHLADSGNMVYP